MKNQINILPIKEWKNVNINYTFQSSIYGDVLLASIENSICYIGFVDTKNKALNDLTRRFPESNFSETNHIIHKEAINAFNNNTSNVSLTLKGTDFQLSIWKSLLTIPKGETTTYGNIANQIKKPKAFRAVGTAIGANPISILIPCHRVIQASGKLGGYMWGLERKLNILEKESC